jgi:hypothetical protein
MLEVGALLSAEPNQNWQSQAKTYGMKNSRAVIEKIAHYIHDQGLCERVLGVEEIFAKSTLDI